MAQLLLSREEAEQNGLPATCMRCGAPSTVAVPKSFWWAPDQGWSILAWDATWNLRPLLFFTRARRCRLNMPLCDRHYRQRCLRRLLLLWTSVLFLILGGIGGVLWVENYWGGLLVGALMGLALWVPFVAAPLHVGAIREREITKESITLVNVSAEFVKAVEAQRAAQARDPP